MSIEQDIQQKEFKNSHHKLLVNILFTNNWVMNEIATILKPYQISSQQFFVLRILGENQPIPVSTNYLIKQMMNENSNVSRLVDKLILKGLAIRQQNVHDKRHVDISITSKGYQLLHLLEEKINLWEVHQLTLATHESTRIVQLLDKISEYELKISR